MTHDTDAGRIWTVLEKSHICMMTTRRGQQLCARPMGIFARRDEHVIYFLTGVRGAKDDDLRAAPEVGITAQHGSDYVSVSGRAEVSDDRALIAKLWNPAAKAWWDGPDDLNIRVLIVTPYAGEIWETPGTFVAYVAMAAAAFSGTKPKVGDAHKATL